MKQTEAIKASDQVEYKMRFITLTQKDTREHIIVNPSQIIFLRRADEGGTVIEHTTGWLIVKETVDEIRSRIDYVVEDRYVPL